MKFNFIYGENMTIIRIDGWTQTGNFGQRVYYQGSTKQRQVIYTSTQKKPVFTSIMLDSWPDGTVRIYVSYRDPDINFEHIKQAFEDVDLPSHAIDLDRILGKVSVKTNHEPWLEMFLLGLAEIQPDVANLFSFIISDLREFCEIELFSKLESKTPRLLLKP